MTPEAFEKMANETGALILDTRDARSFAKGFIPNSINIGIEGNFAPWVGELIPDIKQAILVVADKGKEQEVITRLARVGYDHTIGYLKGGFQSWLKSGKEIDKISSISAAEFADLAAKKKLPAIIDVRKKVEYDSEHIDGAQNLPLDEINQRINDIDKNETQFLYCAGGYRSMIFASILKARGFDNLVDISGGFKTIKSSAKVPVTNSKGLIEHK